MPGKKNNYRKSGAARFRQEEKRNQAEERQKIYDRLSYQEKRELISTRRGKSVKEILRLKGNLNPFA